MGGEEFWAAEWDGYLHFVTLRDKMRQDLSAGRTPLSFAEVGEIAVRELGYIPEQVLYSSGEISRPMWTLAAVWACKVAGMDRDNATSFGQFVAEECGDAAFGPLTGPKAARADKLVRSHPSADQPDGSLRLLPELVKIFA